MNLNGGLEIGVSDMECHVNLPITHIQANTTDLKHADIVLVDTNVSSEVMLETLALANDVKWTIVEPISAEKSYKLLFKNIISLATILKPNDDQFEDLFKILVKEFSIEHTQSKHILYFNFKVFNYLFSSLTSLSNSI